MDFNERLEKSHARMDELKAKIAASGEKAKKARELKKEEIKADMAEVDKALEKFADEVEASVNQSLDVSGKALNQFADDVEDGVNKAMKGAEDSVEGGINAVTANAVLADERREQKINSLRLQAQMNKEARQEKVTAKKDAVNKEMQERRIVELLDYAESCQELTLAMALETEAAVLEAAAEIAEYNEKYGEADA